jgi:hypothetical protein
VDEGLNVDRLLAAWKLQDEVSDLSMKMLRAGIELGARSAIIALAKIYIANNYEIIQTDDFDLAVKEGVERAVEEMDRRMNDVRGS